ncbi:MAG: DUF3800 domain-containing protein [Pseudomonadota bacterium]
MTKEYIIYCDESDSEGQYYSNFYGGAVVSSNDLNFLINTILQKKQELHLHSEIKWSKLTDQYLGKYTDLMDCFFDFIEQGKIKIRIMFTQNIHLPSNLTSYHRRYRYFILYYQFLKHAFGLQYANTTNSQLRFRIYLDWLPINTKIMVEKFKTFIHNLSNTTEFKKANILIPKDQISEVCSHDHVILQCLDVVLGAMQFRLNNKHLEKPIGSYRRSKRTIAKHKLYNHINKRIQRIYPGFNVGCSTSTRSDNSNAWKHQYRHWLFKPKNHQIDLTKSKGSTTKIRT